MFILYVHTEYILLLLVLIDDYDAVFCRIIDVLPLSAAVNESHARTMKELKRHGAANGLGFPDLHDEVFQ